METETKKMLDDYTSACITLLMIELTKNLRWAENKLNNSGKAQDIYDVVQIATQTKEIMEEYDNNKDLDCWINHRKQLKDWAQDILLKGRNKEKENRQDCFEGGIKI